MTNIKRATLASYGTPKSELEKLDVDPIINSITDQHSDKLKSAIQDHFYVYPRSAGLYKIESVESGSVENTYTVNLINTDSCSCYDFLLRCTGSGMFCKHIWRVRFLIKLGALPNQDEDPFSWLLNEIYKDMEWLRDEQLENTDCYETVLNLETEMTNLGRQDINYKKVMNKRAEALIKALRKTM